MTAIIPLGRIIDPTNLLTTPREDVTADQFDPSDTWLMVEAWNTSPACRDVALELADENLRRSQSSRGPREPTPVPETANTRGG